MRMHKLAKSPILFLFSYIFRKHDKPNTAFKKSDVKMQISLLKYFLGNAILTG